jgi:hypothetical protein
MVMPESEKDAQARKVWRKDEPVCVCTPQNPKHREGWHCVTVAQLTVWAQHETCYFTNASDRKRACWQWVWFSQHPEAKRLSGRDQAMGLDQWDDAAGLTEIQKMMFP